MYVCMYYIHVYLICLRATIGLGGGHYTAYGKNFHNGKWYNFNDAMVSEIGTSQLVTSAAYVLFYRRREPEANGTAAGDAKVPSNAKAVTSAAAAKSAVSARARRGGNAPADSTQYTGDKTCRVQIPRGAKPGQSVEVTADNGRRYRITIPKGKKGGDYVQMAY